LWDEQTDAQTTFSGDIHPVALLRSSFQFFFSRTKEQLNLHEAWITFSRKCINSYVLSLVL